MTRSRRTAVALATALSATLVGTLVGGITAPPAAAASLSSASSSATLSAATLSAATLSTDPTPDTTVTAPDGDAVLVTVAPGEGGAAAAGTGSADPVTAARAHAAARAVEFGAASAGADLEVVAVTGLGGGRTVVRLAQRMDGVPVRSGVLVVVVDAAGGLLAISGGLTRTDRPLAWTASPDQARERARTAAARRAGVARTGLRADAAARTVVDPSLLALPGDGASPGWSVIVRDPDRPRADAEVLVDARTGQVLFVSPLAQTLDRVVCDGRNRRTSFTAGVCRAAAAARVEGQPPTGAAQPPAVDSVYDMLGRTSDFFATLGVDLTAMVGSDLGDGRGRQLRATVRYCPPPDVDDCPMINAFWLDGDIGTTNTGGAMFIGDGVSGADDVIAHELTHGVTSAVSGLEYSGEPGAVNESVSDVFGELVDQATLEPSEDPAVEARWLLGEASGIGAVRSMSDPTTSFLGQPKQPDRMGSPNWWSSPDDEGGVHVNSGVGNKAAYLIAVGGTFRGRTMSGIGLAKTAALYWEVANRLPEATTYAVLGGHLRQACAEMAATGVAGLTDDDCAGVGAAVDATEMTTRRIRVAADTAVATPGQRVRITAQVTDSVRVGGLRPHRRAVLGVYARTAAAPEWTLVANRPVDSAGQAVFRVRPSVSTEYLVQAPSVGPWSAADALPVTVAVVPPLVAVAPAGPVVAGQPATVTGTVGAPVDQAAPGEVWLQVGRPWRTVAVAAPAPDGTFVLTWTPDAGGAERLRVVRPADGQYGRATSATLPLTVG